MDRRWHTTQGRHTESAFHGLWDPASFRNGPGISDDQASDGAPPFQHEPVWTVHIGWWRIETPHVVRVRSCLLGLEDAAIAVEPGFHLLPPAIRPANPMRGMDPCHCRVGVPWPGLDWCRPHLISVFSFSGREFATASAAVRCSVTCVASTTRKPGTARANRMRQPSSRPHWNTGTRPLKCALQCWT